MIYPSIDLMEGKAVQLIQGKAENKKIEIEDVISLAEKFARIGPINIIDLDAAFGKGENSTLIKTLAQLYPVRVGGGIRTLERAQEYIAAGAQKILIGSKAFDKSFLSTLRDLIGAEKILIALDSYGEEIVIRGWTEKTTYIAAEVISSLEPYCSGFLYTQVEKEGLMGGCDIERLQKLRKITSHELIAAGGISSLEEIEILHSLNISSVLGMALYTGKISYEALLQCTNEGK